MIEIPFQVWWGGRMADAYWRHLVRIGTIKPRKARSQGVGFLMVVGEPAKDGRRNPKIFRQLRAVVAASGIKRGKGDKQNLQLLYELALWLIRCWRGGGETPKRALRHFHDERLFGILQRHGQIDPMATWWNDITEHEAAKLELRLYHQWPIAARVASTLEAHHKRMTSSRLKPRTAMQRMASQLMGTTSSRLKPRTAMQRMASQLMGTTKS